MKAGRYSPPLRTKNRGTKVEPFSSRSFVVSRWESSIALFASVAASRSLALIAAVTLLHSLKESSISRLVAQLLSTGEGTHRLDSFGDCLSSGATTFCVISGDAAASNSTSLPLPCSA